MKKLKIGKILGTHGLKGELKVRSLSDFNEQRFKKGNSLIVELDNHDIHLEIATCRIHKGNYLVSFKDLQNINLVEKYIGCQVYGFKDDVELEDNEFFYDDLINCDVANNGQVIGKVESIINTGAQDVLSVKTNDKKVLIPYVNAFIKEVDIDNKIINVELIKGFIDED